MDTPKDAVTVSEVTQTLVDFAVDREDIKILLDAIPDQPETGEPMAINKTTLEYEIQLLKIVCTGWAVSYYLVDNPRKSEIATAFWMAIQAFAEKISHMSSNAAGLDINYFHLIRDRADLYIKAMQMNMTESDPASVIGMTFSEVCGSRDEPLMITSGKRMFSATLEGVKRYLNTVEIVPDKADA
ncbi:MAG: hypothetical protein SWH61_14395 [Thermodesulfobacteriota bacterium]|nr:hypothetical protein [Thermodesulfobacteriota bacterium]